MNYTQTNQKGIQLIQALVAKSWSDEVFKQSLISSPHGTIQKFTNKKSELPDDVSIVVEDQTDPSTIYINIPAKPDIDSLELTDEQLESVSGGVLPLLAVIGITVVGGAVVYGAGYLAGRYL